MESKTATHYFSREKTGDHVGILSYTHLSSHLRNIVYANVLYNSFVVFCIPLDIPKHFTKKRDKIGDAFYQGGLPSQNPDKISVLGSTLPHTATLNAKRKSVVKKRLADQSARCVGISYNGIKNGGKEEITETGGREERRPI